jgi:hypothetical protein
VDKNTTALIKYRLIELAAHTPRHASMCHHVGALVGTEDLDHLVVGLVTCSFAPTTYDTTGNKMRRICD